MISALIGILLCPTEDLGWYWPPARVVCHDDGGDQDPEAEAGYHRDRDQAEGGGGRGQVDGAHGVLRRDGVIHPGQWEAVVDQGREEAGGDDEHGVLEQRENDLVHQLVQDDEALQQHEHEGGEVEVDVESHDDFTENREVADDSGEEHEDEADLETDLSNVIRIETAEIWEMSK